MSELLLFWLNHELRLSTFVTDVERDFASGYLLGEILFQLNQQHNFSDFMNSTIADAKIVNFCLLEPSLRNMGVKFDSKAATAIMNGRHGAAASLLCQIKMTAARTGRVPDVSTKSLERKSILPLHNMPVKLAKPAYDAGNHQFFEHSIRRRVKSLAALKREKEEIAEEARKKQAYMRNQEELREQLELTKAERLHRAFIHSHFIKEALEETDSPAWRVALERKSEREQRKARFYQQLLAHQAKQQTRHVSKSSHSKDAVLPSQKSVGYGLRSLSSTLVKADAANSASLVSAASGQASERPGDRAELTNNLNAIKEQKQRREKRKEALERRRKRFVQECGYYHSHMSTIRATTALERLVARGTNSENGVRKDIENVIVYKEIARENREQRCVEYKKQRREDDEAAIDRDASFYGKLVLRYEDDGEMQLLQKAHLETATRAADRHESELIASRIVKEMVDFAMFAAGKREETLFERSPTLFLPEETWREYKVRFAYGCGSIESSSVVADHDSQQLLLSEYELEQYLASFLPFLQHSDYVGSSAKGTAMSPWCPRDSKFIGAVDVLEDRLALGEEVKYVRWISHTMASLSPSPPAGVEIVEDQSEAQGTTEAVTADEKAPEADDEATEAESTAEPDPVASVDASDVNVPVDQPQSVVISPPPKLLRILVFGSPFAGKKTQTMRLADKYDLEVISVHRLLERAIQNGSDIGVEAQRLLSSGCEIPSRIYSQLVLDAVHALETSIVALTANDQEGEAGPVSFTQKKGWIVYDLPGTAEQGQDFEELLTGFVDPAQIPSPYDFESSIAPGCARPALPPKFLHGKSGVDLVFYLDCSCDAAMERCLGQLEDEATREKFHIVSNAPSHESTERHRLRHTHASLSCSELLSLQCLSVQGFAQSQKPWYKQFDTLREVSTLDAEEETHERMVAFVEAFYKQQEDQQLAEQQGREASELELMIMEEQRQQRILTLESAIESAREDHSRCQHALQQAEEAKAKKEELLEHRQALEASQKQVDAAIGNAKEAMHEEIQLAERAAQVFSGRLSPQLSSLLANVWTDMESEYVVVMMRAFNLQREQRRRASDRSKLVIDEFCAFLHRPDAKQSLVNAFQEKFNLVVNEMRFDEATKLELHARTDILQDELSLIIESKVAENVEELSSVTKDGWLEDTCSCIAIVYQAALQSECDRFLVSFQVLVEGYSAASSSPRILAPAIENLRVNQASQDLSCRLFYDASVIEEAAPPVTAAATPTPTAAGSDKKGAVAAKGKGKVAPASAAPVPTAAVAAASNAVDPMKEGSGGDPMAMDDLLASYDRALLKCDAIVQLVTSKVADNGGNDAELAQQAENGGDTSHTATTPTTSDGAFDVCVANLLKGIRYEHDLVQRRIKFLRDAAQRSCEQVTRSMRAVELTLQDVIDERRDREKAAVAALIRYIRAAIEAEVDLPLFINATPEIRYRFPITVQLREDTLIDVDPLSRLVAQAAVDPPPTVEEVHDVLLNARQRRELLDLLQTSCSRLLDASGENGDGDAGGLLVMPVSLLVEILSSATSTPLLPRAWSKCQPHIFAKIGSHFLIQNIGDAAAISTGFVDVSAFLAALGEGDALLRQAMEDEELDQQQLHVDAEGEDQESVRIDPTQDE